MAALPLRPAPGRHGGITYSVRVWNCGRIRIWDSDGTITYNLAVEILSLYPKRVNVETEQRIMRIAKESKEWVDALNSPSPITAIDQGVMGTKTRNNFNWLATTN